MLDAKTTHPAAIASMTDFGLPSNKDVVTKNDIF